MNGNSAHKPTQNGRGQAHVSDWNDVPLILDIELAAQIMMTHPDYLRLRCRQGAFPAYKEGRRWLVTKAALRAHIGEHD